MSLNLQLTGCLIICDNDHPLHKNKIITNNRETKMCQVDICSCICKLTDVKAKKCFSFE